MTLVKMIHETASLMFFAIFFHIHLTKGGKFKWSSLKK